MKRLVLVVTLLGASLAAVYGYTATRREHNYRQFIERGDEALGRAETSSAIEAFSGAIALKADSMLGYLRRGEAYYRREDYDAAMRDLRHAADLDPTATRPRELMGDVNYALQRYSRAAERYQEYIALDDQSPRVLYKLALVEYRAGQPATAVKALRKAVALNDRFAEAYYLLGLCLRDAQRTTEALGALERSIALAPALLHAREQLAELYGRLGRREERLAQLEALLALDPGPSREVVLGLAYARMGQIDRAVPTLRHAAERYPDDRYVYVALGRVWLEAAQARKDRVALGKALEALEPTAGTDDSSEALTLFGRALLLAGDAELAERILQQATDKMPVDPLSFAYLADAAERQGHPEIARQALFDYRALEAPERDARRDAALAARIGALSMQASDPATAVTWYARAAEAAGGDQSLRLRLAEAQWRAGDRQGARATLQRVLEDDPVNEAARTLLRRIR